MTLCLTLRLIGAAAAATWALGVPAQKPGQAIEGGALWYGALQPLRTRREP